MITFDEFCDLKNLSTGTRAAFALFIRDTSVKLSYAAWEVFYNEYLGWLAQRAGNEA